MKFQYLMLIILSIAAAQTVAQTPVWLERMHEIKLLNANREDLRQILGSPIGGEEDYSWAYDFPEGRMSIYLETGRCVWQPESRQWVGWRVPKWTAVQVNFFLAKPISPKKIGVSLNGFRRDRITHDPKSFDYVNDDLGIVYGVSNGKIEDITFRPTKAQQSMKCK